MNLGIAVSDTGPIHYLTLIGEIAILPKLFRRVLIPGEVQMELLHPHPPEKVRTWVLNLPEWIQVRSAPSLRPISKLHLGETATLNLAMRCAADAVLIDDMAGRKAARTLGLDVFGTVALLERSAELNYLDLAAALSKLQDTSFHISQGILEGALLRDRIRRGGK